MFTFEYHYVEYLLGFKKKYSLETYNSDSLNISWWRVSGVTDCSPSSQVHRPDGEQRERVNLHHDEHERSVQNDLDEADDEFGVKQVDGLGLPRVLALDVDRVQNVFDGYVGHDRQQDGVLEAEDQLHRRPLGDRAVVRVVHEQVV